MYMNINSNLRSVASNSNDEQISIKTEKNSGESTKDSCVKYINLYLFGFNTASCLAVMNLTKN